MCRLNKGLRVRSAVEIGGRPPMISRRVTHTSVKTRPYGPGVPLALHNWNAEIKYKKKKIR